MNAPDATPAPPELALSLSADRRLIWNEGDSVRYVVADLTARHFPEPQHETTPALNLAFCIDVSGSMGGDKLAAAKQAATEMVATLSERDHLSVVAFSDEASVLLRARKMSDAGKRAARRAIESLDVLGCTALFDGWAAAAECVAEQQEATPAAAHRVVLLSDGLANLGLTDHTAIAAHCEQLAARGVLTTTVGIGVGYDERLLGAMAESGGGRMHDAAEAAEIAEVVMAELGEGRRAALERVSLRIAIPAGVRKMEVVGAWANRCTEWEAVVQLGTLFRDTPKRVVLRLFCEAGAVGDTLVIGADASGSSPDGSSHFAAYTKTLEFRFADGRENSAQRRAMDVTDVAMRAWHAEILRTVAPMNRDDRAAAQRYLRRQLRYFDLYARSVPGGSELTAELVRLTQRVREDMGERTRKDLYRLGHVRSRGEYDLRASWREPEL